MENAPHNPFQPPLVVDSNPVCRPKFHHPTCPSTLDLKLHRGEGDGVGSSADSSSGHPDPVDSIVSHYDASRVPEQTGVTSFDDDDGIYVRLSGDPVRGLDKLSQNLYDVHPHQGSYDGLANINSNILFNRQTLTDGEVVDAASEFTEAGADMDPLAIKPERSVGPGRHYHLLGTSDETQGPGSVEATGTQANKGLISNWVFASWPRPEESVSEVREIIQRAKELGVLRDPAIGNHLQGVKTPLHCTKSVTTYGRSMAAMRKLLAAMTACSTSSMWEARPAAAARFSTIKDKPPPTEAHWKKSSSPSSAARQIRIHESPQGVIQRMMPLDRTILFDVDTESFQREDVEAYDIDRITEAACVVARVFRARKLGIVFTYAPGPGPKAFSIRYDPTLPHAVAADSFFPSDPREDWQVRISPFALPSWDTSGDRHYMIRTLAHEFMHILGFRHHNAGSSEAQVSSVHWPGTVDGNRWSIMYTSVHRQLWFSEEDFRVIQELYSAANGAVVRNGRVIMDVDPYDGCYVL